MKRAPVRHEIEYAAYLAVKAVFGRMSRRAARRFGHQLGRLAFRVDRRHRNRALRNLELALPEVGRRERLDVARACFEHFGAAFLEIALADRLTADELDAIFDIEGWEHAEAADAKGRGLLLMGGHIGSFEMAAYPLARRFGELNVVARPMNNPYVERDMRRVRQRFGNRLLDKTGAAHRMLNVLRRKGRVGVVIDQRVRPSQGIRVPFFGQPSWTSPVPAILSIYTGAPAVPMFCYPADGGRYHLRCDPAIEPGGFEAGPEGEEALTRRYLEVIEEEVRRRPEQWLWMHRRWR